MGWNPKPATGLLSQIFSQCDSTMALVVYGYNKMTLFKYVGDWFISVAVTIINYDLNKNMNTASYNSW